MVRVWDVVGAMVLGSIGGVCWVVANMGRGGYVWGVVLVGGVFRGRHWLTSRAQAPADGLLSTLGINEEGGGGVGPR